MSTASAGRIEIQSSRWWALFTLKITQWIFPDRLAVDGDSIFARKVQFWLAPWMRDENHMRISHISEIGHDRGLVWDTLTIESTGGLSPIVVRGLRKGASQRFVTHVRGMMGRVPSAATPRAMQPPSQSA